MRNARWAFMLVLLPALSGCYAYVPVPLPQAAPSPAVRAHLGHGLEVRLDERTVSMVERVDGALVAVQGDSLFLWAHGFAAGGAPRRLATGRAMPIARNSVQRLEVKRFSIRRTGAFLGLAAVAFLVLERGLDSWGGGSEAPPGGSDPDRR